MNTKTKAILLSYIRAAAASAIALFLAGQTDVKTLALAFLSGLAGPALKYLDSSAKDFGRGSK